VDMNRRNQNGIRDEKAPAHLPRGATAVSPGQRNTTMRRPRIKVLAIREPPLRIVRLPAAFTLPEPWVEGPMVAVEFAITPDQRCNFVIDRCPGMLDGSVPYPCPVST